MGAEHMLPPLSVEASSVQRLDQYSQLLSRLELLLEGGNARPACCLAHIAHILQRTSCSAQDSFHLYPSHPFNPHAEDPLAPTLARHLKSSPHRPPLLVGSH